MKKQLRENRKAQAPVLFRIGGGGGRNKEGKGYFWLSTTVKLILPLLKKNHINKGAEQCNMCVPLVRKKAQETAHRNSAERNNQDYLFGCLCHGGYKLYSLFCGTKTKTIKPASPQVPKKAARRNASLTEQTNPDGGDRGSTLLLMRINCVSYCCVSHHIYLRTRWGT